MGINCCKKDKKIFDITDIDIEYIKSKDSDSLEYNNSKSDNYEEYIFLNSNYIDPYY